MCSQFVLLKSLFFDMRWYKCVIEDPCDLTTR